MNDTKPFNAEQAKAGAPYRCRDGQEATVLKWDSRQNQYPLHGVCGDADMPSSWTLAGTYYDHGELDGYDLVMLPLGYTDGKPVFVGDELVDPSGATFTPGPRDSGHLAGCRWPAPEKQYPVTQLTAAELLQIIADVKGKGGFAGEARHIANAALRHAIDNGYAATKEAYDQCSRDLGKAERLLEALGYRSAGNGEWEARDCAARDLAIAEAVSSATKAAAYPAIFSYTCAIKFDKLDLAAIIATVKP